MLINVDTSIRFCVITSCSTALTLNVPFLMLAHPEPETLVPLRILADIAIVNPLVIAWFFNAKNLLCF